MSKKMLATLAVSVLLVAAPAHADDSCNIDNRGDNNVINCTIVRQEAPGDQQDSPRRHVREYDDAWQTEPGANAPFYTAPVAAPSPVMRWYPPRPMPGPFMVRPYGGSFFGGYRGRR